MMIGKRPDLFIIDAFNSDPKPELSTSTLLVNLEILHRRVMAAQQAYSMAYFEWLHLGEQIKERLTDEQRKEMKAFNWGAKL